MDDAVGDPDSLPTAVGALLALAQIGDALTRADDAAKAIEQGLALAVPAVVGFCEVRQASYQTDGVLPWPPLAAGRPPDGPLVDDAVTRVLATGSPLLLPGISGRPALVVTPLRSRTKVIGTLLVESAGQAWAAPFVETLAALIGLRLDADPPSWEHGAVAQSRLGLASRPQSAAVARGFVRDVLVRNGLAPQVDTAVLLVSELVSNALRHGIGPYDLLVQCDDDGASVTVADRSPTSPRPRRPLHDTFGDAEPQELDPSGLDEDGRGLLLVEALADDWGWTTATGGKRVWFRLAR